MYAKFSNDSIAEIRITCPALTIHPINHGPRTGQSYLSAPACHNWIWWYVLRMCRNSQGDFQRFIILPVIGLTAAYELRSRYAADEMSITIIARDMPHDGLESTGWASPWAVSPLTQRISMLHPPLINKASNPGRELVPSGEQG